MNFKFRTLALVLFSILLFSNNGWSGNDPCSATPLPNNMTSFQEYSNLMNTGSGVEDPGCGSYVFADIWFSVIVPPNGMLDIVTLAGTLTNGAMAVYDGTCSNLNLLSCTEDDNCGNTIMPIMSLSNLTPGSIIYIRIWAEGGGPNGTFEIRVSDGPISSPPIPTTQTVGSAQYTAQDCVQLTTSTTGQSGCAWDPNQVDMNQPFDETFNFNFGNNDAGADGICWVFQNNPAGLGACGTTGQNIAADFGNSFIVEFDTYDNGPGFSDIFNDHVSVNVNGNMGAAINGPIDLGNIEDGQDHEIRFVWDPFTNSYEIYFDGILYISGTYDIINNCLGGNPNCYWGFTASTGGAVNTHTVCPVEVPEYPAGSSATVEVEICEGESYFAGGANQTTSGIYEDLYAAANGCDSSIVTILTVNPVSNFDYETALCLGECELVGNEIFCNSGSYQILFENGAANGCDSIVNLDLTILDPIAVAAPPAPLTCFNISTVIDASASTSGPGIVNYSWTGPGPGCILSGQNTTTPVVNCPGFYTMTLVQTLNGTTCSSSVTVEVIDGSILPIVEAGNNQNIDCSANCVTLSSAGSDSGPNFELTWTGPNNFTSNDANPLVCEPGMYTLTILNTATGCLSSDFVMVTGDATPPDIEVTTSGLITCLNGSATLDGSNSSGVGALTFEWLDANNNSIGFDPQINVSNAGAYTLVITDQTNGCTSDTLVVVVENTTDPIAIASVGDELDCSTNPVALDGSASSGVGTITYEWQNTNGDVIGVGNTQITNQPGVYTLIVTDSENGCTNATTVEVFQNIDPPLADATLSGELTCIDLQVTLDGSNSSGTNPIDFEWQDASGSTIGQTASVDVQISGDYTLIVTDTENACSDSLSLEVIENTIPPNPDIVSSGLLTCINEMIELDGSNSSGAGNISYAWENANGDDLGMDPTVDITEPGDITLVITDDANGCTASTTFEVEQNIVSPQADAGDNAFITCTETETTLDGSNSSTGNDITYEWINAGGVTVGTEISVDVSETGIYTLIVTDQTNGCTASSTVEVEPDANLPTADAGQGDELTCDVNQVSLDGSASSIGPNISYEWFDPDDNSLGPDLMIDVDVPGTYILVVTDADNGCTASASVEITEDIESPVADAGDPGLLTCANTNYTLNAEDSSGGVLDYEWQNANNDVIGVTETVDVDQPGVYTLIVTDTGNGCTANATVEVSEDIEAPTADAGSPATLTCAETTVTLDAANSSGGTLSFLWQNANGDIVSQAVNGEVNEAGEYTVIVTNEDNGCTASSTVEVAEDITAPIADAGLDDTLNCIINTVTLTGINSTGGTLLFEWRDSSNNLIEDSVQVEVTETGVYTLIVTDTENGCTAIDEVLVNGDYESPIADAGQDDILTCQVTELTLDASNSSANGPLSFEWLDEMNNSVGQDAQLNINAPGTYTLIVSDAGNGCTNSTEVNINQNIESPFVDAGPDASLTCNQSTVMLTGEGNSSNGDVTFEWQNAGGVTVGDEANAEVSETGVYTLIVTDTENGCTASSTVEVIPDANLPIADAGSSFTLTCSESMATLDGSSSSTGQNINYQWQNANGDVLSNDLSTETSIPGIYTLIVTDSDNGCSATSTVEIFEDVEPPIANAGMDGILNCEDTEVILDGSMSSVNNGVITNFEWFDENGNLISFVSVADATEPGTYTLVVTGSNGCTASDQVIVAVDASVPEAVTGPGGLLTCSNTIIELGDVNTNQGLNVSYQWTDSNGNIIDQTPEISVTVPDVYTLLVTNLDNNCETSADIEILQDIEAPNADAGVEAELNCVLTEYALGGPGTSAGPEYSYSWLDENQQELSTTMDLLISTPGIYTLVVTNESNGCTSNEMVTISQDIEAPIADAGASGILTCDVTSVTLDGSNSSGSNLSFEWLNESGNQIGNTPTTEVMETGNYTLIVTNTDNGCTAESATVVIPDANLPTAVADPNGILTCDVSTVNIDGSASSSISGNTAFQWLDEMGNPFSGSDNIDVSTPGFYTLIITDLDNGCSSTTSVEVIENIEPPVVDAGLNQVITCSQTEVTLSGSGGNGTNLSFEWQNDQGQQVGVTASIQVETVGVYTLVITDLDNGCSATSQVLVTPDTDLPIVEVGTAATLTCATTVVSLNGEASDQGNEFVYEWQDQNGIVISTDLITEVDLPGIYTLTVLNNDNGCTSRTKYK